MKGKKEDWFFDEVFNERRMTRRKNIFLSFTVTEIILFDAIEVITVSSIDFHGFLKETMKISSLFFVCMTLIEC